MWPWADDEVEVRRIQPYQATKAYRCPGCQQEIPRGTGHVVAVPYAAPEDRPHWHNGCWTNKAKRRPGRTSPRHR